MEAPSDISRESLTLFNLLLNLSGCFDVAAEKSLIAGEILG